MNDKVYEAKVLVWVYRYCPWIGAFMIFGQILGPVVNFTRFQFGTKVDAQFVSRVRFAASSTSSRGLGQSSCAYNYRVAEKENYLIQDCDLIPGFRPEPGRTYPVVFYKENPPRILSQVGYAPGWVRLFTLLIGVVLVVLPRVLLPRMKNFPKA